MPVYGGAVAPPDCAAWDISGMARTAAISGPPSRRSLALDDPAPMLGIHLSTLDVAPFTGPGSRPLSAAERAYLARYQRWREEDRGYGAIQSTRPQTVSYGLNDSPAGWLPGCWEVAGLVDSGGTSTPPSPATLAHGGDLVPGHPDDHVLHAGTTWTTGGWQPNCASPM